MNHEALICTIKVTDHPNADRLAVGHVYGETVIVGKDTPDGALGVYFPCETQLGEEFAVGNDLIRRKDENGNAAGGFFEVNRRVRVQKLRGIKSYGFWCPIENLGVLGDYGHLKDGDSVGTLNGKVVCKKYVTPRQARANSNKQKVKPETKWFPKHKDTDKLKYHVGKLNPGDPLVVTLKMHGTSQRVGWSLTDRELTWKDKIAKFFGIAVDETELRYYNGTRNVTLKGNNTGFHCESWREKVAAKITPFLEKNMVVYFEVVGYENDNPIMPSHFTRKSSNPDLRKQYGDQIDYTYGCPQGDFKVYVYRIAYVLPSGHVVDLTWDEVMRRCEEWSVNHVPEITRFIYDGDSEKLLKKMDELAEGPDLIDPTHIREGVCIRVNSSASKIFKNKSFDFLEMELSAKDSDDYVDMEESA